MKWVNGLSRLPHLKPLPQHYYFLESKHEKYIQRLLTPNLATVNKLTLNNLQLVSRECCLTSLSCTLSTTRPAAKRPSFSAPKHDNSSSLFLSQTFLFSAMYWPTQDNLQKTKYICFSYSEKKFFHQKKAMRKLHVRVFIKMESYIIFNGSYINEA